MRTISPMLALRACRDDTGGGLLFSRSIKLLDTETRACAVMKEEAAACTHSPTSTSKNLADGDYN